MKWGKFHTYWLLVISLLITGGVYGLICRGQLLLGLLSAMGLLAFFIAIVGHGLTGLWRGALIDSNNTISLSRFQMTVWTVLILSALLTAALYNVNHDVLQALAIEVPKELWALIGLSTVSLVAAPAIQYGKKGWEAPPDATLQLKSELKRQGDLAADIQLNGLIVANRTPKSASWGDLFTGEDVGNAAHLDLTRVQMFFFTVVTAFCYTVAVFHYFATAGEMITKFPVLDQSLLALLAISHGGYLVGKTIPQGMPGLQRRDPNVVSDAALSDDVHLGCDACGDTHADDAYTDDDQLPAARGGVAP